MWFRLFLCLFIVRLSYGHVHGRRHHATKTKRKIVGGVAATIEEYPFEAFIVLNFTDRRLVCGGSILDETTILTAAHCLINAEAGEYTSSLIRVGSTNKFRGGNVINVAEAIPHPEYNRKTMNNDIAILKLAESIHFRRNIQPIPVSEFMPVPGTLVSIAGWGARAEGNNTERTLFAMEIPILNRGYCVRMYRKSGIPLHKYTFCAGDADGKLDSCQGDSGGPVIYNNKQIGIVSWGEGCGNKEKPGIYTDVTKFRNFIYNYLNK